MFLSPPSTLPPLTCNFHIVSFHKTFGSSSHHLSTAYKTLCKLIPVLFFQPYPSLLNLGVPHSLFEPYEVAIFVGQKLLNTSKLIWFSHCSFMPRRFCFFSSPCLKNVTVYTVSTLIRSHFWGVVSAPFHCSHSPCAALSCSTTTLCCHCLCFPCLQGQGSHLTYLGIHPPVSSTSIWKVTRCLLIRVGCIRHLVSQS